jgi:hypothetical protein
MNKRCQATTASGSQCKCYATCTVNGLPYCDQHGAKVVRDSAVAIEELAGNVGKKT